MPAKSSLISIWNIVKEINLQPISREAEEPVRIALVGAPESGCQELAAQMARDPHRPGVAVDSLSLILDPADSQLSFDADLVVLVIKPATAGPYSAYSHEKELALKWARAGKKVLILFNAAAAPESFNLSDTWVSWKSRRVLTGPVQDTQFLLDKFVPAVIDLLPDKLIALGRFYPLFRHAVARNLINETCLSNTTYSLTTGLAELIPFLDIPLYVTDMLVLTKAQAFLAYKLGLTLGMSTRWQDYTAEFGGVLGAGFMMRQLARGLIGLIPGWGLIPKVAVAYSGTYAVGQVVLQWYLTGRQVTQKQLIQISHQASSRGKSLGSQLLHRWPRITFRRKPRELPLSPSSRTCPNCQRTNAADALFCQYCGHPFSENSQ